MDFVKINGEIVEVLAENVMMFGREWCEIECYPTEKYYERDGEWVFKSGEDLNVLYTEEFSLFINKVEGYMVLVIFTKSHYDETNSLVIDDNGRILYCTI